MADIDDDDSDCVLWPDAVDMEEDLEDDGIPGADPTFLMLMFPEPLDDTNVISAVYALTHNWILFKTPKACFAALGVDAVVLKKVRDLPRTPGAFPFLRVCGSHVFIEKKGFLMVTPDGKDVVPFDGDFDSFLAPSVLRPVCSLLDTDPRFVKKAFSFGKTDIGRPVHDISIETPICKLMIPSRRDNYRRMADVTGVSEFSTKFAEYPAVLDLDTLTFQTLEMTEPELVAFQACWEIFTLIHNPDGSYVYIVRSEFGEIRVTRPLYTRKHLFQSGFGIPALNPTSRKPVRLQNWVNQYCRREYLRTT